MLACEEGRAPSQGSLSTQAHLKVRGRKERERARGGGNLSRSEGQERMDTARGASQLPCGQSARAALSAVRGGARWVEGTAARAENGC